MYMYICIYTCISGIHRGQIGALDPLKLELQSIISVLWVLRPEPWFSVEQQVLLSTESNLQLQHYLLFSK